MERREKYEWGDGVYTLLSWFKKDRVRQARVFVAGAGALGNEVVKDLALFGVGTIYVVDFDRIELSNLTRSVLFREEDAYAHHYKAEVVARRAMEINPQIRVIPIVGNLASEVGLGIYRSVDVIIGCLDSRMARYQLNRMAMRAGKTWIDGSIENLTGVVRVYTPGINCYECGLSKEDFQNLMLRTGCADVVRTQTSHGRVATTPVSASIVGAVEAQEAMKVIHIDTYDGQMPYSILQGKIWRYEGLTNVTNIYRMASWKRTCPSHELWEPIKIAPTLSANMTVREALTTIKEICNARTAQIMMMNNKFVESVVTERPERSYEMMIPESKLDEAIHDNAELRRLSRLTILHKINYENIDDDFPHQELTLKQVGIPPYDVLKVATDQGEVYVELSADKF